MDPHDHPSARHSCRRGRSGSGAAIGRRSPNPWSRSATGRASCTRALRRLFEGGRAEENSLDAAVVALAADAVSPSRHAQTTKKATKTCGYCTIDNL